MSRITFFLFGLMIYSAQSQDSSLQLSDIMQGYDFIGHSPSFESWSPNSETVYFSWQKGASNQIERYRYHIQTEEIAPLNEQDKNIPFYGFKTSPDAEEAYYKIGKSLLEYNHKTGESKVIYQDFSAIKIERIEPHKVILKRKQDNVWNYIAFDRQNGTFTYLTDIRNDSESDSLAAENEFPQDQKTLFYTLKKNAEAAAAQESYDAKFEQPVPAKIYTDGQQMTQSELSPSNSFLGFVLTKYPKNKETIYLSYITEDGHSTKKIARTKAGEAKDPEHSLLISDLNQSKTFTVDLSDLEGIDKTPAYYEEYGHQTDNYTKKLFIHLHGFNESGGKLLVEIKSHDNKDRWIGTVSTKTKRFELHDHQHDEAWIGGPGITGWNMVAGNMGWINNHQYFFQSERTGFSHLYLFDLQEKESLALTKGAYEVHNAQLSDDQSYFYIQTNQTHPGNRDFFKLEISNQKQTPILTKDGFHEVHLSPDEKWLLVNYHYKNQPAELFIGQNEKNAQLKRITNSQSAEFSAYSWRKPEIVSFQASDQAMVPARLYQPDPAIKNDAAILFVHGAGYLQNAHNGWSGYYREYMFHNLLCDLGYTVLDVDYRASKGYGRDFRTAIYRHMGGRDLEDFRDARLFLINEQDIDSNRVGIYGGSYGGFITLMALLTSPDEFACGAAIRSVTDWAHYNYPYTSNILNTPQLDPRAYEQSSPIYFAEGLNDPLLMLHGMVDDNVQYQDVVRLSQRFIELGKTQWDLVGYPVEPHGFIEASSWTDEYRRILELFNEHLLTSAP